MNKQFTCITGPRYDPIIVTVGLNGVPADEPLTPKLARQAARAAFGHSDGVTVWSNDDHGYRLYGWSARKIRKEQNKEEADA